MRSLQGPATILCTTLLLLLTSGCEEPRHVPNKSKNAVAHGPGPAAAAPEPEFIIGKRTQEIKNATPEVAAGGAKEVGTKITAKDYITLQGNAYVTTIGRTSILSIEHAMNLYKAEHDRYPKDYEEFMADIIQANNISLPKLPAYQEYGYDENEHKLVILEYEARKN